MSKVSSLWVGSDLSIIHKISLASFLYYGHEVTLYVYDLDLKVPAGIIKRDAREILPESEIFYHQGSLAAFADCFRYKMIQDTGAMWVDADTICFTKNFFDDVDTVFILESQDPVIYAQGILKLPQNSAIVKDLVEQSFKIKEDLSDETVWGALGPWLLTELVNKHGLQRYGVDVEKVSLYRSMYDAPKFWDPRFKKEIIKKSKDAYSGTFYNSGLDKIGFTQKNKIAKFSAIEVFYLKFLKNRF